MAYLHEIIDPNFDPRAVETARDVDHLGLHELNLFDQDERLSDGAFIEEATGLPYDNSTETDVTIIERIIGGHIIDTSVPPRRLDKNDLAAQWLRENDLNQAA